MVGRSTVPVDTADRLTRTRTHTRPPWCRLLQATAHCGDEAEFAWNPEFLREGFAVEDTMRPDRLVFGVASDWASPIGGGLAPCSMPAYRWWSPTLPTAELVKVSANSFLATKISFINTMEVCENTDVQQLAAALSYDPRIGGRLLRPGLGFGGGCLPKDPGRARLDVARLLQAEGAVVRGLRPAGDGRRPADLPGPAVCACELAGSRAARRIEWTPWTPGSSCAAASSCPKRS